MILNKAQASGIDGKLVIITDIMLKNSGICFYESINNAGFWQKICFEA